MGFGFNRPKPLCFWRAERAGVDTLRKKLAYIFLATVALATAQTAQYNGTPVRISAGPDSVDYTTLIEYNGSNLPVYKGTAATAQPTFTWSISGSTLTSIVDSSNTATVTTASAHGLKVGNKVTIAGVLSDTDLNGTYYVASAATSTTFTITTANVTDATYNAAGTQVSTNAPRTTAAIWKITFYQYDGSNNLVSSSNSPWSSIWDNRAVTTGATKVTYE